MLSLNNSSLLILICSALTVSVLLTGCPPATEDLIEAPMVFHSELSQEAVLTGDPGVESMADARATAILTGNRLYIHGAFSGLTSPLLDTDEATGDRGIHLRPGGPDEENSPLHGLRVRLTEDERNGIFHGEIELTDEQVVRLFDEELYIDIRTTDFPDGELRGQILSANEVIAELNPHP